MGNSFHETIKDLLQVVAAFAVLCIGLITNANVEQKKSTKESRAVVILFTNMAYMRSLYALFQVDRSLCGREWTRTKQLSSALSSHPVPLQARIPHSRL